MIFRWDKGRLNTGYFKMTLINFRNFDLHILKMPRSSCIHTHIDPVPDALKNKYSKHNRFNIILKRAKEGGIFQLTDKKGYLPEDHWAADVMSIRERRKRTFKFIASEQYHKVTQVFKGTRYVLSIGWLS